MSLTPRLSTVDFSSYFQHLLDLFLGVIKMGGDSNHPASRGYKHAVGEKPIQKVLGRALTRHKSDNPRGFYAGAGTEHRVALCQQALP